MALGMVRKIGIIFSGILVAASLVVSGGTAMAAKTFKVSNQFPPNHHISIALQYFAEKVDEYSGGELKATVYDSGQLYRDAEIVRAIRSGGTEVGLVPVNKWSGILSSVDIFEVPFIFKELSSLEVFLENGGSAILDQEFSRYGTTVLFWVDYGYVQFFNSKRPITSPKDFKGLTMRTWSAMDSETIKTLGAAPTIISSGELYMALQRGTVDGTTTGMPAAISRQVAQVQKFMTLSNYSTAEFLVQANAKWFKSLTDKERDVLQKASKDTERFIRNNLAKAEEEALQQIIAAGVEVHVTTPEERAAFIEATKGLREEYLQRSGESGKKLIEVVDTYLK